jgi:hypothetical protein
MNTHETIGRVQIPLPDDIGTKAVENIAEVEQIRKEPSVSDRILEAYDVAMEYAKQLTDADFATAVMQKLTRSSVRGSHIEINGEDQVRKMLRDTTGWQPVVTNLEDKRITCFQGRLPAWLKYKAYAAYATIREIAQKYGIAGLSTVQARPGYQKDDEFYFCTLLRFPADVLTVQLKDDKSGIEFCHQFFAGREVSSLLKVDDGDTVVRCGVRIPELSELPANRGQSYKKNHSTNRAH